MIIKMKDNLIFPLFLDTDEVRRLDGIASLLSSLKQGG
jgi:hypothetical protein